MSAHNHIAQGDVIGCPACDKREHRLAEPLDMPASPAAPDLSAFPRVQHRIEGGKFVCPGDENSWCHRYPDCDGEHEFWPCGCDYIGHADCWIEPWISASDLSDSHDEADGIDALRDEDFPDGDVSWSWEDEYVLFSYCDPAPNQSDGES